jgi:hypothetical protein
MPFNGVPRTPEGLLGAQYDALALDLLESVPALTFPLSVQTFSRMRTDPQISAVLKAYTYPLRSATYVVNPSGCRDEVVQFVSDQWGLPIMGDDAGPGPARRKGLRWDQHIRLALLMLPFGFSPFAKWYDVGGSPLRARLGGLSERLPQTVSDIRINEDGSLQGIIQYGAEDMIPAANLLWYSHEQEGSAWHGRSLMREAYGPWLLKHEMWRVMGQSSRRFGMGVPTVTAPPGSPPADVTAAADIAAGYRAGDQSGIGLPDGFKFDLTGLSGSVPDTKAFVEYLDGQIATSVLAEILNLDTASTGNRALGETVIGLLQMSWSATAKEITGPATDLSIEMVDINFGEDEPAPQIMCTDVTRPELTSEAIAALVSAKALTADIGLENEVRLRYGLPPITDADRTAAMPQPVVPPAPVNPPATDPNAPTAPAPKTAQPAGAPAGG